ncbi:hypothetical protein ETAR_05830 [Edwardsiella tarda]
MKVAASQTTVNDFDGADLNDAVPLVVGTDLVHTGGFRIEDNLAGDWGTHFAVLIVSLYVRLTVLIRE